MMTYNIPPRCRAIKESDICRIKELYESGEPYRSISKILSIREPILGKFFKYNNFPNAKRRAYDMRTAPTVESISTEELMKCVSLGMRRTEIAKHFNISDGTMIHILEHKNISIGNRVTKPTNYIQHHSTQWRSLLLERQSEIIAKYEETGKIKDVANYIGCNGIVISTFFDHINYQYKKNNLDSFWQHKDTIIDQYFNQMKSLVELGKIYNCTGFKIRQFIERQGYTLRTKAAISKDNVYDIDYAKGRFNMAKSKSYVLPSGKEIQVQGYEPNFLDHVLNNSIFTEDQIEFKPRRIRYYFNDYAKYYYPDFYIPHLNLIIEVKSSWIMKRQGIEQNMAKFAATETQGFNHVNILDNDFSVLDRFR